MLKKVLASVVLGSLFIYLGFALSTLGNNFPLKAYYNNLSADAKREIQCLADNIYFESAYEPEKGKIAVAFVTLNRVNSGLYPDNICDVVKQRTKNVCQFSWYCEERPKRISYSGVLTNGQSSLYNDIRNLAIYVYANYEKMEDPTKGALFYHADYVTPIWRKQMIKTTQIGQHIFYKRKDI